MKYFFLNGEKYSLENTITLLELLEYFNYNKTLLVLEYNNKICNKEKWTTVFLEHEDKVEIVSIVESKFSERSSYVIFKIPSFWLFQ